MKRAKANRSPLLGASLIKTKERKMLDQIFGGKPWFKSMTGWGALVLTMAWTLVPGLAEMGVISPETTATLTGMMTKAGSVLGMLGIRKAATTANVT